jgi:hypothetical protein
MTVNGGCFSRVGENGSEGGTGTAGNSGKHINVATSPKLFTIDNIKSVAP